MKCLQVKRGKGLRLFVAVCVQHIWFVVWQGSKPFFCDFVRLEMRCREKRHLHEYWHVRVLICLIWSQNHPAAIATIALASDSKVAAFIRRIEHPGSKP